MSSSSSSTTTTIIEMMVSPLNCVVFVVCWMLPIAYWLLRKRRLVAYRRKARPLALFLAELTAGSSTGYDKKFFALLHNSLFRKVERGIVRAMARCVTAKYGKFLSLDMSTVVVEEKGSVVSAKGKANFQHAQNVPVRAGWVLNNEGLWRVVGFDVSPISSEPFDVFSYVTAADFAPFGEKFVCSLFARLPTDAIAMMQSTLQEKYKDEAAVSKLASDIGKVLRACGGLRNPTEVDLTLVDSSTVRTGDEPGCKINGVRLEFAVLGAQRDLKVSCKIVFVGLQCRVIRYHVEAQEPHTKPVIVDADKL